MARILVINEHGNTNRYILLALLESLGHRATIVTSIARVMAVAKDEKPELVIVVESRHSPALLYLEGLFNGGLTAPIAVLIANFDHESTSGRIKAYQDQGFLALPMPSLEQEEFVMKNILHTSHIPFVQLLEGQFTKSKSN